MSDCLLTTLPVIVSGDREKVGYFMLKKALDNEDTSFKIWGVFTNPFWLRWNSNTYYGAGTLSSPSQIGTGTLYPTYHLAWSNKTGRTNNQVASWIERKYIRALELKVGTVIKENTGFEYLLSSSDFEFLDVDDRNILENRDFKAPALKCLRYDASGLQNYEIQELLNNCPSLIYIALLGKGDLDSNDNSSTNSRDSISTNTVQNVVFPDNLKYIRVSVPLITNLSANCVETSISSSTRGKINDFVEKAIAAGRQTGELSVRCADDSLSSGLTFTYVSQGETVTTTLDAKLTADNIPHAKGNYFKIVWDSTAATPITLSGEVTSQRSYNINFSNYRQASKLGPEFGVTE